MKAVDPMTNRNKRSEKLSTRLACESRRMPPSRPAMTEAIAVAVTVAMTTKCSQVPFSSPNTVFRPALICRAPIASEAATPKRVPMTAKMSIAWPIGPLIRSPNSG